MCKQLLMDSIKEQMDLGEAAYDYENQTSVLLVIGVNGVGKTTSIGKLAGQFKEQGKKVLLAAADTFRAAAIDQLAEWTNRAGVELIAQQEGSDPAAVVYDAIVSLEEEEGRIVYSLPSNPLKDPKLYEESVKNGWGIQFSHTLDEQIRGQIQAGFTLKDLYEDTDGSGFLHEHGVPTFWATLAIKEN